MEHFPLTKQELSNIEYSVDENLITPKFACIMLEELEKIENRIERLKKKLTMLCKKSGTKKRLTRTIIPPEIQTKEFYEL